MSDSLECPIFKYYPTVWQDSGGIMVPFRCSDGYYGCQVCTKVGSYGSMVGHVQTHERAAIKFNGYKFYRCQNTSNPHYHCVCKNTIMTKKAFLKHLSVCPKTAPPASPVLSTGAPQTAPPASPVRSTGGPKTATPASPVLSTGGPKTAPPASPVLSTGGPQEEPGILRDTRAALRWLRTNQKLLRGQVTEPSVLQMEEEDRCAAVKAALESDYSEAKDPFLFIFQLRQDMDAFIDACAEQQGLQISCMFTETVVVDC